VKPAEWRKQKNEPRPNSGSAPKPRIGKAVNQYYGDAASRNAESNQRKIRFVGEEARQSPKIHIEKVAGRMGLVDHWIEAI